MGSHPNDQLLERALERWRRQRLWAIADHMIELNLDLRLAQDGLGIANRLTAHFYDGDDDLDDAIVDASSGTSTFKTNQQGLFLVK